MGPSVPLYVLCLCGPNGRGLVVPSACPGPLPWAEICRLYASKLEIHHWRPASDSDWPITVSVLALMDALTLGLLEHWTYEPLAHAA